MQPWRAVGNPKRDGSLKKNRRPQRKESKTTHGKTFSRHVNLRGADALRPAYIVCPGFSEAVGHGRRPADLRARPNVRRRPGFARLAQTGIQIEKRRARQGYSQEAYRGRSEKEGPFHGGTPQAGS